MLNYIIRRILYAIPVVIGVTFLVFMISHLTPGDPVRMMAGEDASEADVEALRVKLGMDKPLMMQYGNYLYRVAHFDLGKSIRSNRNIVDEVKTRFRNTIELAIAGTIVASVVGVLLGIISAINHNKIGDSLVMGFSLLGISSPTFLVAIFLIIIFVSKLSILPATGRGGPAFSAEGFKYIILPSLTLGLSAAASIARLTRSSVLEVLQEEYIRTVEAKGLKKKKVLFKHVLRNASVPIMTIIGLQFGYLLGGAVITETIFSWPGIGKYTIDAIMAKDFPAVQGSVLIIALLFVAVNLIVDLLYGVLDPRISYD